MDGRDLGRRRDPARRATVFARARRGLVDPRAPRARGVESRPAVPLQRDPRGPSRSRGSAPMVAGATLRRADGRRALARRGACPCAHAGERLTVRAALHPATSRVATMDKSPDLRTFAALISQQNPAVLKWRATWRARGACRRGCGQAVFTMRTIMTRAGVSALGVLLTVAPGCRDDRSDADDGADDAADDGGDDGGSGESGTPADGGDGPAPVYLSPSEHLVRISMALRGTRPSAEELAAVEADPAALEAIVDGYLDSPNFGETMRDLHNESLLVLADYFFYPAGYVDLPPLEGTDPYTLNRSVMEASLRLVEHVIMEDKPYSEIVTADYTLANGIVAAIFGLPYEGDGESWELSSWEDGRGNAGILSDGWMYQRHSSTISNANRGRANALSRSLLCYDFASRDVELDASINLADPDEVANAVVENAA